ncbi:hypothetical protein evm_008996 [Chilo suppressalis]|nr:hypothetical protein evm_008996 [Chilo suppressalis]
MKLLFAELCFILCLALSQQGLLPHPAPRIWRPHKVQSQQAPLQTSGTEQRIAPFENWQFRKRRETENNAEHRKETPLRNYRYRHRLPESEFDADGMLFLSKPKNRQNRDLNALMNKVVEYKMNEGKYLRRNTLDLFTDKELERLQTVVDGLEEDDLVMEKAKRRPDTYIDFADLVI